MRSPHNIHLNYVPELEKSPKLSGATLINQITFFLNIWVDLATGLEARMLAKAEALSGTPRVQARAILASTGPGWRGEADLSALWGQVVPSIMPASECVTLTVGNAVWRVDVNHQEALRNPNEQWSLTWGRFRLSSEGISLYVDISPNPLTSLRTTHKAQITVF